MVDTGLLSRLRARPRILPQTQMPFTPEERGETLAERQRLISYQDQEGFATKIGKAIMAAPVDLADTILSSLRVTDRGDVNETILRDTLQWPAAADWVRQNQGAVEVASGVLGIAGTAYVSALAVPKLMHSGFMAATTLGKGYRALEGITINAKRGARLAEAAAAKNGEFLRVLAPANRKYLMASTASMTTQAASQEAMLALSMNTNSFIWDDEDMSMNLLFGGLGLGIGAGAGFIGARYGIRKWANSPAVRDTRERALDPGAYSRIREVIATPPPSTAGFIPKESSKLTAQMLEARYNIEAGNASPTLQTNRSALQTQVTGQAHETLQKIAAKGSPLIPNSRFSVEVASSAGRSSEGTHLVEGLHADPTLLYGADSIAKTNPNVPTATVLQNRSNGIDGLLQSQDPLDVAAGQRLARQEPLILVNRAWVPPDVGSVIADYKPARIQKQPSTQERFFQGSNGRTIHIDEFGRLAIQNPNKVGPGPRVAVRTAAAWESLTIPDQLDVIAAMRETLDYRVRSRQKFILPANPTWLQLDYAVELYNRSPDLVDFASQAKLGSLTDMQVASLQKKGKILGQRPAITELDRIRYNLPLPTSLERVTDAHGDNIRLLFTTANQTGVTSEDLIGARRAGQQLLELAEGQKLDESLTGGLFGFNLDRDGNWMKPVIGFFSDTEVQQWTKYSLAESIAWSKAARFHTLTSPASGRLSRELTEEIYNSPLLRDAHRVSGLADNQVTGTSNALSALSKTILTAEMAARDNPTVLAALRLRHLANQKTDHHLAEVLATHMGDVQNRMAAATAFSSRHLLMQFMSNSTGWDLVRDPVDLGNGFFGFLLNEKSAANVKLLGRPVKPQEMMVNPRTGNTMALDKLGLEFMEKFNRVTDELLTEKNGIRAAMGLAPLKNRPWYVPPPTTRGKFVGFTFNANDEVVRGGAIIAETAEEFNRLRLAQEAQLQPGERFMTREQVQAHGDLWDRAQMDWIDPGNIMAPGVRAKGTLSASTVNQQAIPEAMEWLRSSYQKVTDDTIRAIFDNNLNIIRARKAVAEQSIGKTQRSINDIYEDALLGRMAGKSEKSPSGRVMERVDERIDASLAASWPAARGGARHVTDLFRKLGVRKTPKGETFESLARELQDYTPYKNGADFLEQTHRISPPPEIKAIAAQLNRLSAALVLRVLEFPHAAMNLIGIMTNMPSILQSQGITTLPTIAKNGSSIRFIDTYRMMAGGFRDMLSRKSSAEWQYMLRNGDTTQSISEVNYRLGLLESRGAFRKVILGDPTSKNKVAQKGIDGILSLATDTTEEWSRSWAHFIGLRLADAHGVVGKEARHNFAREIANSAIANYDPLNRPELFHSAFGSLYGLFASYMLQYNMRLFRWMETGQFAAVGRQLATQMSLFGMASTPGFAALQWLGGGVLAGDASEGKTPLDAIYERFGPVAGAAVAHGGITQLATLFGLTPGESPALFSRGDANLRSPNLNMTQIMAGLGVVKTIGEGIWNLTEETLFDGSPTSNQRVAEILANGMPNRAIKGAITVLAGGGQDVDRSGQVISETRNTFETVYRMMGLRSVRQQGEIEAYYLNNRALEQDAARLSRLRLSTRSLIRAGEFDRLPEVFQKYIDSGGKPWNFGQWIRSQIDEAVDPRGQKQLLRVMRSPGYESLARRVEMMTGVSAAESLQPRQ